MAETYSEHRFDQRVSAAKAALDEVFGDTGVARRRTRAALEDLVEHIRSMLYALED